MTLTLDLPAEVQDALTQAARTQGVTPERLALNDLRRLYSAPVAQAPQTWEERLRALAMPSVPGHAPSLTPGDFDREGLYED